MKKIQDCLPKGTAVTRDASSIGPTRPVQIVTRAACAPMHAGRIRGRGRRAERILSERALREGGLAPNGEPNDDRSE